MCAHVDSVEGIQRAIRAGVRSIEHGHFVDEERSDEMARKNAWLSLQPFDKGDNTSRRNSSEGRTHVPLGPCGAQWAKEHGGAWADLLVVDGNPLENLSMLADPGTSLALVMKNGAVHKNTLGE